MDCFIGEIQAFAFGFTPYGWLPCNGQLIAIRQYSTLYALLATQYGGDGIQTFGLPNLNGRIAIGAGQGAGTMPYRVGQNGGTPTVSLNLSQASHGHTLPAANSEANAQSAPGSAVYLGATGQRGASSPLYVPSGSGGQPASPVNMSPFVSQAGGSQPHNNMGPYQVVNYCIAMVGIFPSRS